MIKLDKGCVGLPNGGIGKLTGGYLIQETVIYKVFPMTVDISAATVTLGAALTYNGSQQTKQIQSVVVDGVALTNGVDYTVSGNTATTVGTYTMTITGIGDYEGTVTAEYSIAKLSLTKPTVSGSYTYNGSTRTATVSNYNSTYMTQSGTASTATAGSYTLTFALKDKNNTQWADGTTGNVTGTWAIAKLSLTKPTISGSFTYNGSAKSCTVSGMNSTYITQGGTASATNAGTYTVTFTLKSTTNTQWSDGTTAAVSRTWSIAQATGSISVSPTKLGILGPVGTTGQAVITYTGDGSISVASSATGVATVSRSGTTVTVTMVAEGSATITITLAAGTNYTGASCTITVTTKVPVLSYYGTATELSKARYDLVATTVGNYALFGGGYTTSQVDTVDAYNKSLTRSTPRVLSVARNQFAVTTVGNYALFGGGMAINTAIKDTVDAYNKSLTKSTPTALSVARYYIAATTVGNYALFGGGRTEGPFSDTVDAYDSSLTRSTATALSLARDRIAATTVGSYALFGGGVGNGYRNKVDAYDESLTRSTATALSVARGYIAATTVGSYALFGGGYNASYKNTVDAYDESLTRSKPTALSVARWYLAATTVGSYALFGGGSDSSSSFDTVEAYDSSLTRSIPTALSVARGYIAATTVGSYALFSGGCYRIYTDYGGELIQEAMSVNTVDVYQYN